jgi:hypothetical protein
MTPEISAAARTCLVRGAQALVEMYTNTALLLNACDVAARGYEQRTDEFRLSTTQNIPANLRLPVELDVAFHRSVLPRQYQDPVLRRIAEDFVIRMISVVDGVFEDIFEETLKLVDAQLGEAEVSKRVRAAWQTEANGQVKLVNFLVDQAGLQSPSNRRSTIQMVFDRYYELREIRHALVHTAGILSPKHLDRLRILSERLPPNQRHGSLATAPFLATGRVLLTVPELLALRYWAYTTVFGYLQVAFQESEAPPAQA